MRAIAIAIAIVPGEVAARTVVVVVDSAEAPAEVALVTSAAVVARPAGGPEATAPTAVEAPADEGGTTGVVASRPAVRVSRVVGRGAPTIETADSAAPAAGPEADTPAAGPEVRPAVAMPVAGRLVVTVAGRLVPAAAVAMPVAGRLVPAVAMPVAGRLVPAVAMPVAGRLVVTVAGRLVPAVATPAATADGEVAPVATPAAEAADPVATPGEGRERDRMDATIDRAPLPGATLTAHVKVAMPGPPGVATGRVPRDRIRATAIAPGRVDTTRTRDTTLGVPAVPVPGRRVVLRARCGAGSPGAVGVTAPTISSRTTVVARAKVARPLGRVADDRVVQIAETVPIAKIEETVPIAKIAETVPIAKIGETVPGLLRPGDREPTEDHVRGGTTTRRRAHGGRGESSRWVVSVAI